MYNDIKLN
uniref:Uncharacterized protein n=1 Tax=Anguilla anguilla TaxID=7936 RepID=A0A0E9R454_ANGAN